MNIDLSRFKVIHGERVVRALSLLHMEISDDIKCRYHGKNAQCLEEKCPFYEEDEKEA